MSKHAISVVIPVYNRADTICVCLESVVRQTVPPMEVVLIDDGSSDGSAETIEKWKATNADCPVQVLCHRQENQGKCAALNVGVSMARGDWIGFNDSDDLWVADKLEKQLRLLEEHPSTQVCFSDSRFINNPSLTRTNFEICGFSQSRAIRANVLPAPYRTLAENPNGFFMQTVLARRSCIEQVFPLDSELRVSQDIDLVFRLSLVSDFCFSDESLVEIDRTPSRSEGLTTQHDMNSRFRLEMRERIVKGWLAIDSPKIREVAPLLRRQLSKAQHRIGLSLYDSGAKSEGRAYLREALRTRCTLRTFARYFLTRLRCAVS